MVFESRKKERKNKLFNTKNIVGVFVILLMVTSVLGVFQGGSVVTKYNGFKIKQKDVNQYTLKINDKEYQFSFHPQNLEYITIDPLLIQRIKNSKQQHLTFNHNDTFISEIELTRFELQTKFPEEFEIYLDSGVTNNTAPYTTLPVITCDNATETINVFYFTQGNETKIYEEGFCTIIQVQSIYAVRETKERLLYGLLGVI